MVTSLAAAVVLAAVQVLPGFVPTLEGRREKATLSAAGGFSAAFVFLELLPQVRERADAVTGRTEDLLRFVEDEAFFLTLVGLLVFYGLERLARATSGGGRAAADDPVGLVQTAAFGGYYLVIGYLLWSQAEAGASDLVGYTIAVGVHFLVVDYGLRSHHPVAYRKVGRWLLAGAVLTGWLVGWRTTLPEGVVGVGLAFVAGAVMLITLKEELPAETDGRYLPFVAGAGGYTALLAVL